MHACMYDSMYMCNSIKEGVVQGVQEITCEESIVGGAKEDEDKRMPYAKIWIHI